MNNHKIKTFIGFSIRMGKAVFGVDNIRQCKAKIQLIVYDSSLSANSIDKLRCHADKYKIRCELVEFSLFDLTKRENIKAIAILDKSLANAIISELDGGAK